MQIAAKPKLGNKNLPGYRVGARRYNLFSTTADLDW